MSTNQRYLVGALALIVIAAGAYFFTAQNDAPPAAQDEAEETATTTDVSLQQEETDALPTQTLTTPEPQANESEEPAVTAQEDTQSSDATTQQSEPDSLQARLAAAGTYEGDPVPDTEQFMIVIYEDGVFKPETLSVKQGETVFFWNRSGADARFAADAHPTHTLYPGTSAAQCDAAESGEIFDACGGIAHRNGWTFTFNELGEWGYHNHYAPANTGVIVVTE